MPAASATLAADRHDDDRADHDRLDDDAAPLLRDPAGRHAGQDRRRLRAADPGDHGEEPDHDPNKIFAGQILELPIASEIVVTSLPAVTTAVGATAAPAITTASPAVTTVAP